MTIGKKNFMIDTFSNAFYFGSRFISNILVFSLLIGSFSLEEYGVFIFFVTLLSQLEFIQSGFSVSLERFIPLYKDKIDVSNLIGMVSIVYLVFGILISILLWILSLFNIFDLIQLHNWEQYVDILIFFAPLVWFFKTFSFALKGSKDYRAENSINLFYLLVEVPLIYIMLTCSFNLKQIFLATFIIIFLKHFSHFIAFYKRHVLMINKISFKRVFEQFQKVKNFSFWNFTSSFSGVIINQFDKTLIVLFVGTASLPIYYGINQFLKFYTATLGIINSSVIPYFTKKIDAIDNTTFNQIALKGTMISTFIGMAFAGFLITYSKNIFELISKEYIIEYTSIFNIGILLYALIGSRSFVNKLHQCKADHVSLIAQFGLITSFLYPIVFYILTRQFGLSGAILSTILTHLIIFPFWIFKLFKTTSLNVINYFKKIITNFLKIFIVFTPIFLINKYLFPNPSIHNIIIQAFVIILALFMIDKQQKKNSIINLFKRLA